MKSNFSSLNIAQELITHLEGVNLEEAEQFVEWWCQENNV